MQTRVTPSTAEVQVWPISVQAGPESVLAGCGVLVGWAGAVWTVGDSSVVTPGVIEAGEASGIVTIALASVGSAEAGGRSFPLQAEKKKCDYCTENKTQLWHPCASKSYGLSSFAS